MKMLKSQKYENEGVGVLINQFKGKWRDKGMKNAKVHCKNYQIAPTYTKAKRCLLTGVDQTGRRLALQQGIYGTGVGGTKVFVSTPMRDD